MDEVPRDEVKHSLMDLRNLRVFCQGSLGVRVELLQFRPDLFRRRDWTTCILTRVDHGPCAADVAGSNLHRQGLGHLRGEVFIFFADFKICPFPSPRGAVSFRGPDGLLPQTLQVTVPPEGQVPRDGRSRALDLHPLVAPHALEDEPWDHVVRLQCKLRGWAVGGFPCELEALAQFLADLAAKVRCDVKRTNTSCILLHFEVSSFDVLSAV